MLSPCLALDLIPDKTGRAVIGADTVGGAETDTRPTAVRFPAATFYGTFVEAALHASVCFQLKNHWLCIRLAWL